MGDQVERKLTTIVAADIAGYSRLMAADEEGTLSRLKTNRRELIDPKIKEYRGRIIKTTGDGMLVEFASVVDAVRCAVDVQRGILARNRNIPLDRRIEFRVGINIGDVIVDGEDIYGDGVNIAARLENIAEPGGIRVSATVRDHVLDKLGFAFDDLGEQSVKNIPRPVRVYRVQLGDGEAPRTAATSPLNAKAKPGSVRKPLVWTGAVVLLLLVMVAGGWFALKPAGTPPPSSAVSSAARLSLVVLPFVNLSGDASQDYLADVLTEELTTSLSRLPGSFVVSRTTAFTYRGKAVDVKQIGQDLGVRYVLEGSAQATGKRARVNAQLIDAASGAHLWADQFDADRTDILQMQDEIVTRIARSLQIELTAVEAARVARAHPENPDAEDLAMQCESAYLRYGPGRPEMQTAYELCERALRIDDHNVRALAILAARLVGRVTTVQSADRAADLREAAELISRALAIDPNSYLVHFAKGALLAPDRPDESIAESERALALNPSFIPVYINLWSASWTAGRTEKGIEYADTALRLSPRDPYRWAFLQVKGVSFITLSRYEDATDWFKRAIAANPDSPLAYAGLAASLALSGHEMEAREALKLYLALPLNNTKTIAQYKERRPFDSPYLRDHFERLYQGLRTAGMPEE